MHMWQEMILFICAFVLSNGVIMLVCWFSHSIMSSSRSSITLADFMMLSDRRRALTHTSERLSILDALGSGRYKPHRPPELVTCTGGQDSGGSEAEDSESEEEAHMTQALATRCPVRMGEEGKCWRIQKELEAKAEEAKLIDRKSNQEPKETGSTLGPATEPTADWASQLLFLEEEETLRFKNELRAVNWKMANRATGISTWDSDLDDFNMDEMFSIGSAEYRRYHALVPVQRFDADYIMMGQEDAIDNESQIMTEFN